VQFKDLSREIGHTEVIRLRETPCKWVFKVSSTLLAPQPVEPSLGAPVFGALSPGRPHQVGGRAVVGGAGVEGRQDPRLRIESGQSAKTLVLIDRRSNPAGV
jgi:hypothetical protein